MRAEAQRFWARARECRIKAVVARDEATRKDLLDIAEQLEAEAAKIEAETPEPS
jgi:hypothetical protein